MNYSDGNEARIGDVVAIDEKYRGVVVACIDRDEYFTENSREQWSYLRIGVMVDTEFGGLVHYQSDDGEHITLVSRAHDITT